LNYKELYEIALQDLIRLSIKSNNVITKASFSGKDADEVSEVLEICNHIYQTFVKEVK